MNAMSTNLSESPIGIFTTDCGLVVRSWDAWLEEATGIPAAEACGKALSELLPDLGTRGLLSRFENVLTGVVEVLAPVFHRYLIACPPKHPSKRFSNMQQRVTIAPLREEDRIIGAMVTIEDVTSRLEMERDIAEQLHSPDEETRLKAAEALSKEDRLEPVQPLMGVLGDKSWRVRRAAVEGLGRRGGPEAVAALLRSLRYEHRNLSVLNSALQVLSMMEMDTFTPLIEFLKDPDPELRIYAALALGETSHVRSVSALIEALGDPDANVRYHAVEALGKLRATDAVEALGAVAESEDFFLAFAALDALMRIGDPRICPRIIPLLKDDLLKEPTAEALGKLGDQDAVEPLAGLLNGPDAPVHVVVRALASLSNRYEKLYGEGAHIADLVRRSINQTGTGNLIEALHAANEEQLHALVTVLSWLQDPAVERALIQQLGRPAARRDILKALVRYGKRVTALLIEELHSDDLDARRQAVEALAWIRDVDSVPALVEVLRMDEDLSVAAASALAQLRDPGAFEALLSFLNHPDSGVRLASISALNSIGHPDMPRHMTRMLADANPRLRDSAVRIAGYFGYGECANLLFERCRDQDEGVRATAIEHIVYLDDERVGPTLLEAFRRDSAKVRAAAARAMAVLDETFALPHLLEALSDTDEWVRYFAVRSIGRFNLPGGELGVNTDIANTLIRLIREDPAYHVRAAAVETLGRTGETEAIEALAPLSLGKDRDLARAALIALGRIGHEDAFPHIMTALRSPDPVMRKDAARALSGYRTRDAVSALEWAAKDKEPSVSEAAMEILGSMAIPDSITVLLNLTVDDLHREAAIERLSKLGEEKLDLITRGSAWADPKVRCAVVEVLARIKRRRATEHIAGALGDDEPAVRLAAIRALRLLGSRLGEEKIKELAGSDPETSVRDAARSTLRAT